MRLKRLVYILVLAFVAVFYITQGSGCANIVAPTGGPKDTLPPVLVEVRPADSTLNFSGNRIHFTFDEYVTLQDLTQQLIVSPVPKVTPVIESKLRTITVRIKDTLEPNTTYSINFGNAVRDINEGNIIKDFTYIFSTGNRLDSRELRGRVLVAETGMPDSTMIAMLYTTRDDSAVIKQNPRYISRLDSSGHFIFRNLPVGVFYLYALKDEGGAKKYLSKSQLFAFSESTVYTGRENQPFLLYAFAEKEEPPKPSLSRTTQPALKTAEERRLRFQSSIENGEQDLLSDFTMSFPTGLKTFDSTKFVFTNEAFAKPAGNYFVMLDSTRRKIVIHYPWLPEQAFHIIMNKDFAEDSLGRKLFRTDTLDFRTKKEADYGSVHLEFPKLDLSTHPVLQLVQSGAVVYSYVFTSRTFDLKRFKPGDYELRILYDTNQNGIWDTGEFVGKRRQPKRVTAIRYKLNIRPNWTREGTIEF